MSEAIIFLSPIRYFKNLILNPSEENYQRGLLLQLSLLMCFGALVWTVVVIAADKGQLSSIPLLYIGLTIINAAICRSGNRQNFGCNFQIFISILFPFIFQITMGGLASSGMVMIWSITALCGVLTFARGNMMYWWLALTLVLICGSIALDDWAAANFRNPIDISSKWFFAINGTLSGTAIFFIGLYFVSTSENVKKKLAKTNGKLQAANNGLSLKNTELIQGLEYAQTIQNAINPSREKVTTHFPNSFLMHKPKDHVSGDFLWVTEASGLRIATCVDCTGHGISGGLLAMMGACIINSLVHEQKITDPGSLLDQVNRIVFERLNQKDTGNKDGMEMSVIALDPQTNKMHFATAGGSVYHYSKLENTVLRFRMNSSHVGGALSGKDQRFTTHSIELEPGDRIFLATDGFSDQFGGPKNKKFSRSRFKEMISSSSGSSMEQTCKMFENTLRDWSIDKEQTDDILVFGFEA
ncbi:PP2C family protein-serine/threonine phosphatase [Halocola ammonii]